MPEAEVVCARKTEILFALYNLDVGKDLLKRIYPRLWRGIIHHYDFEGMFTGVLKNAGNRLAQIVE